MSDADQTAYPVPRDTQSDLLVRALVQYVEKFGLSDLARQALCQSRPPAAHNGPSANQPRERP